MIMQSLKLLLQTHSKKKFFQLYFEKEALFVSAKDKQIFANIFNFTALDELLSTHKITYPFLKLFKDGVEFPKQNFENRQDSSGTLYIDIPKVIECFSIGYSMVLNRVDQLSSHLNSFSRSLEVDLNMKVETNLYLTPPNNYGFNIHFDPHDVFIMQLEGSKEWTLFESDIPLVTDGLKISERPQESFVEKRKFLLNKGDVLYIPRGTYHQAKSNDETSMHLTFGIYPLLGYHLINQLALKSQEELFFRRAVPSQGLSNKGMEEYYKQFFVKMNELLAPPILEEVIHNKQIDLLKKQDLNSQGLLLNQLKSEFLSNDSIVRLRPGLNPKLKEGKRVLKIFIPQQIIDLPIFISPLIKRLLKEEEVEVSKIETIGNNDQKLKILKLLISKGFLEIL
jgi:hypothetical protein